MCGRYQFSLEQPALRAMWEQAQQRFPNIRMEAGEIFPTQFVPVLVDEGGALRPQPLRWGFPGAAGKGAVINARAETAASKPMFRSSLQSRRCAVPTSGFFEWTHDHAKNKYRFRMADSEVLYLAGLYRDFDGERRFVILTRPADASIADVHDRMPVILREGQLDAWVRDSRQTEFLLTQQAPPLARHSEDYEQQSLF